MLHKDIGKGFCVLVEVIRFSKKIVGSTFLEADKHSSGRKRAVFFLGWTAQIVVENDQELMNIVMKLDIVFSQETKKVKGYLLSQQKLSKFYDHKGPKVYFDSSNNLYLPWKPFFWNDGHVDRITQNHIRHWQIWM